MRSGTIYMLVIVEILFAGCGLQRNLQASLKPEQMAELKSAFTGICMYDEEAQKVIVNHDADKWFIPASNTKLLTLYAAMKYLPDSLPGWYSYASEDTLYLMPGGDPTFLHAAFPFQKIWELLRSSQQTVVLVRPKKMFTYKGYGWAWNNYQESYMAERAVMPVYGNLVHVSKASGSIKIIPSYFETRLNKEHADPEKPVVLRREPDENRYTVYNAENNYTYRPFTQAGDSDLVFKLLTDTLIRAGCKEPLLTSVIPRGTFQPVYTQATDSVLQYMIHNSDNFFAEQFLLMVGNQLSGVLSDRATIASLLHTDYADLPDDPHWADGSGLSRNNLISPQAFVLLLKKMKSSFPWPRIASIMVKGGEGTLANYYLGYRQNLFAKTGTLSGHSTLSGYLITKKGRHLIFSYLVNNHQLSAATVKHAVEKNLEHIIDQY